MKRMTNYWSVLVVLFAIGFWLPCHVAVADLFEADYASGTIYKFTPGGVQSAFASGFDRPEGLAFDSAGNLYEADYGSGNIYEIKPDGVVHGPFASGLAEPTYLAFQGITLPVPEPSVLGLLAVGVSAFLIRRRDC